LGRNVAFAWGGYAVNVIAGFVMPRLISDHLGQATLGIWDFAWSIVSYFGLVQLGLSGSVQRYVAKYRARGDFQNLSKSVSTIGLSLKISGAAAMLLTVVVALWVVPLFQAKLGTAVDTTRLIILYLGLEVAFSIMLTVYGAILVGCHRWDMYNLISAVGYAVMTAGMIAALLSGGGLPSLALVHCLSMTAGEVARWWLARRVCPEFVMDFRLATWATWMEQAKYSAKSLIPRVADLISNQSLSVLITAFLGPAMLAIYSRPRSLMGHGQAIAAKFGSILIPTASSIHAKSDKGQLRATFLNSTSFISSLSMPAVVAASVFGDELIRLWMGKAYVYKGLIPILAVGCLPGVVQEPAWNILAGMNQHGRLALWKLAAAICSAVLLGIGLAFSHWHLVGAALAFALPQLLVNSIAAPVIACRLLDAPLSQYYGRTYLKPLIGTAALVACLELALRSYKAAPVTAIVLTGLACLILAVIYWQAFSSLKRSHSCEGSPLIHPAENQDKSASEPLL
jgi:O-antigen/teichoic acid export membrane protein